MPRRKTQEEAIADFRRVHGNRYGYDDVVYINNRTEVKIICPIHGEFKQRPYDHQAGIGCKSCGGISSGNTRRASLKDVIRNFKEVHGNKYNYDHVIYKNADIKIKIECPLHGIFEQAPAAHARGKGCLQCAKTIRCWTYTNWQSTAETSSHFESYKLYIIKLKKHLYKIGKTFNTLQKRFAHIPYEGIEVIDVIEDENPRYISEKEHELLKLCEDFRIKPEKDFAGMHECFSSIAPIIPLLE